MIVLVLKCLEIRVDGQCFTFCGFFSDQFVGVFLIPLTLNPRGLKFGCFGLLWWFQCWASGI